MHRRPLSLALAGLVLALAPGCGTDDAGMASVQVDTLASGAIQVTSPREGILPPGDRWELEEELRIGTATGEGPELFGQVQGLAADDEGRILVLDSQAREIRIFDADGAHLRTVGGQGGGPGEIANANGLAIHPEDGSVWVVDPGNGRYSVFESNGDFRTTHPRPIGYFAIPWPGGFDHDGRLHDVAPGGLVRLNDEGVAVDTIALPEDDTPRIRVTAGDGSGLMTMAPPFGPRLHWYFDPRGMVWTAVSDAFHFTARDVDGEVRRVVRRPHDPVPVSRAEGDSVVRVMREQIAQFSQRSPQVEGDMTPPSHRPAFTTFVVDDQGRLWVEPSRASDAPRELHVFDPEGRFLGPVAVDPGLRISYPRTHFRGDHLYAVVTDDLDTPYVVRYRIHRP
ncbi:MAG: 6-bladed beta-propeller [Gemmatimonadales bacterium]|nr:MAG: 6-bladed beta-propeller [Gemmatimonadales bacterium]